jgi:hypothetical protein
MKYKKSFRFSTDKESNNDFSNFFTDVKTSEENSAKKLTLTKINELKKHKNKNQKRFETTKQLDEKTKQLPVLLIKKTFKKK